MPRERETGVLREELRLTGTHVGCGTGSCGACTVVLNGVTTKSCCVLAADTDGDRIETIEGLATLLGDDRDMLEDVLMAAFNDALRKVEQTVQERFAGMTAGLGLPGGFKLPF